MEDKEIKYITNLLQHILAIELWRGNLSQQDIGKHLGLSTGSVNKILKGVSRKITTNVESI